MSEQNIKNHSNLSVQIDAILFYLGEPVEVSFLAKTLEVSKEEIEEAVGKLQESLQDCGVRIVNHNGEVALVTAPEMSEVIEKIVKAERERDLGRAGIETLAIVAYKGPVSKKEIEYIRGVNSQWALRNLLLRGLIERKNSEKDERVAVYTVTTDALRHLGLGSVADLPEYSDVKNKLIYESTNITNDANGYE